MLSIKSFLANILLLTLHPFTIVFGVLLLAILGGLFDEFITAVFQGVIWGNVFMFLVFVVISLIEIIARKKYEKKSIFLEKVLLGSGLTVFVLYFAFRAFQLYEFIRS